MRIRKFAKFAASAAGASAPPVVPAALRAEVETNVCELNRSPWDVITFAPQSRVEEDEDEEDGDDKRGVDVVRGYSARKKPSVKVLKEEKMECYSREREKKKTMCRKSGSKGWKCGKEAKEGHSLCDHHLALKSCYRNESCRKPDAVAGEEYSRGRKRYHSSTAASVSDFYYYSGFGPRWRRRRGADADDDVAPASAPLPSDGAVVDDDVDEGTDAAHEQRVANDVDNAGGHDDYEDDDDDDVDDAHYARKPRKARSLKSLL